MLYSIKDREDSEKLEELASIQNQVKVVRLQDKLGKQSFHEDMKKVFEPATLLLENTSDDITKTFMETSIKNIKALENLTNKLLEKLKDRAKIANSFMSSLSKITNPENTSQFKSVEISSSKGVNDLLIHNSIPFTLHENLLTFRDTVKNSK